MKYPAVYLAGEGASGEILSIAFASRGQWQDAGAKAVHLAKNTKSRIVSKAICMDGGRADYRGLVRFSGKAENSASSVECETLILDSKSSSSSYPVIISERDDAEISHEARTGRVSEELIFYLRSRGIPEDEALALIVQGFVGDVMKEIPLEYAIELNRLIKMEMEGSIG